MKKYILVFLAFIFSCSHHNYHNVLGIIPSIILKQCDLESRIFYVVSGDFNSYEKIATVKKAFEYWNGIFGFDLFVDISRLGQQTNLHNLSVEIEPLEGTPYGGVLGYTRVQWDDDYCIRFSKIVLNESRTSKSTKEMVETVLRHEIGHVLGIPHNARPGSLMHETVSEKRKHPIDLTPNEINEVINKYQQEIGEKNED